MGSNRLARRRERHSERCEMRKDDLLYAESKLDINTVAGQSNNDLIRYSDAVDYGNDSQQDKDHSQNNLNVWHYFRKFFCYWLF